MTDMGDVDPDEKLGATGGLTLGGVLIVEDRGPGWGAALLKPAATPIGEERLGLPVWTLCVGDGGSLGALKPALTPNGVVGEASASPAWGADG